MTSLVRAATAASAWTRRPLTDREAHRPRNHVGRVAHTQMCHVEKPREQLPYRRERQLPLCSLAGMGGALMPFASHLADQLRRSGPRRTEIDLACGDCMITRHSLPSYHGNDCLFSRTYPGTVTAGCFATSLESIRSCDAGASGAAIFPGRARASKRPCELCPRPYRATQRRRSSPTRRRLEPLFSTFCSMEWESEFKPPTRPARARELRRKRILPIAQTLTRRPRSRLPPQPR
jgi:hypothetical protein